MADPTAVNREFIKDALGRIIPVNSPLAQSGTSAVVEKTPTQIQRENIAAQGVPAEEDNYVQLRDVKEPRVVDVVDPVIPITPKAEEQEQLVQREPAQQAVQPVQSEAPQVATADTSFDKILSEQDQLKKKMEEDFKIEKEQREAKIKSVEDKLAELNKNPQQIDNRSLWSKSSTGQKILLALGAVLSSATPQGAESFRKGIQETIDRDLNIQLKEIEEGRADKNLLLNQLKELTGSSEAAAAAYKQNMYQIIGQKLSAQAQKAQSQIQRQVAAQNYKVAMGAAEMEKAKLYQAMEKAQAEGKIQGYEGVIKDPVAAREFRQQMSEAPQVFTEINNLKSINKQFLGGALNPSSRASAKQSQNLLIGKLREAIAGPGTLSEGDRALLEDAIANPTDFFTLGSSNEIKLNQLEKAYKNKLESNATAYGLRKIGKPSSFTPQG